MGPEQWKSSKSGDNALGAVEPVSGGGDKQVKELHATP
jgi:hypothetical protein